MPFLGLSKPAHPKTNTPCDEDVEDIASGITGMEASANHPIPLLRSNAAHVAARDLARAVALRVQQPLDLHLPHSSVSPCLPYLSLSPGSATAS